VQDLFLRLADGITSRLRGDEVYTASFAGEDSDFVRFTGGAVRQAGAVTQRTLTLDLIAGRRHAVGRVALSDDLDTDRRRLDRLVGELRARRAALPEDPFLLYASEVRSSTRAAENRLPLSADVVGEVGAAARGRDLVGCYAAGGIYAGFANAFGQRNWYASYSYDLDWSLHHGAGTAVKARYAGVEWEPAALASRMGAAGEQLAILARPTHTIAPGRYRAYLAPAALEEVLGMVAAEGFSLRARQTKTTPLLRMAEGAVQLHPAVTIVEDTQAGIAPDFQEAGFVRPPRVPLVRDGAAVGCLVSPRSAQEFGAVTNGAAATEAPLSLDMAAGTLPATDVLRRLDTGVYVSNVWYLNYSDRSACRLTGLTRFASFWVERGTIAAPLGVMRFDESLYRILGDRLAGLTAERELILDPDTYGARSVRSARVPGALVEEFTFTL
jgi:predicted Zn-dependent protease